MYACRPACTCSLMHVNARHMHVNLVYDFDISFSFAIWLMTFAICYILQLQLLSSLQLLEFHTDLWTFFLLFIWIRLCTTKELIIHQYGNTPPKSRWPFNIVAIKDEVWVLYRWINHKHPGGIRDEAQYGRVHYGLMFVIYSTIQYSNQVLYCYYKDRYDFNTKTSIYSVKNCSCLGTITLLNYSLLDYFYNIVSLAL